MDYSVRAKNVVILLMNFHFYQFDIREIIKFNFFKLNKIYVMYNYNFIKLNYNKKYKNLIINY